eukprot:EC787981.1.p1 GENE.EC787981.1~~EC787981.1.p1  ORF type:complete len:111 (+),score=24.84 EC787981.1:43-375(+)
MSYKKKYTLEERSAEAADIRQKFATRIPVIVEKDRRCGLPDIDRTKYLLPGDLLFSQFIQVVRKRIEMPPTPCAVPGCGHHADAHRQRTQCHLRGAQGGGWIRVHCVFGH